MARQINQKAISAKIDNEIFAQMELYCKRTETKRNKLINEALNEYLKLHWV